MKKKAIVVLAFLLCVGTVGLFAEHPKGLGIGVQGGWSGGVGGGLSLKLPSVPVFWTIDLDYGGLGVAGDFYLIDQTLVKDLGWYLGIGVYGYFGVWADELSIAAGGRIPIGLSWRPIDLLEIYAQAVPSIGLSVSPNLGLWPNFFGGNLGIRLWF
jgi:hypothetical protein